MRQETLDKLTRDKEADIEHFANFITQPIIQKPLGQYLEALKAKSKKKQNLHFYRREGNIYSIFNDDDVDVEEQGTLSIELTTNNVID